MHLTAWSAPSRQCTHSPTSDPTAQCDTVRHTATEYSEKSSDLTLPTLRFLKTWKRLKLAQDHFLTDFSIGKDFVKQSLDLEVPERSGKSHMSEKTITAGRQSIRELETWAFRPLLLLAPSLVFSSKKLRKFDLLALSSLFCTITLRLPYLVRVSLFLHDLLPSSLFFMFPAQQVFPPVVLVFCLVPSSSSHLCFTWKNRIPVFNSCSCRVCSCPYPLYGYPSFFLLSFLVGKVSALMISSLRCCLISFPHVPCPTISDSMPPLSSLGFFFLPSCPQSLLSHACSKKFQVVFWAAQR